METNKTDNLLKGFFSEYKQEIADNGFTQRVMRRLPEQTYRGWIVWIFAALGMTITIYLGITIGLVEQIASLLKHVPVYYLIAGIFCFPLVGTAGFYFSQNKNYHLI
jgi:formate-dependent nitrite reductase membrane component NrfD